MKREKSNYIIQSVSHALDVLEQFRGELNELGVTELSKRLKLHKNNVFRLLATLESRGYIEQNKTSENYRLGIRCLQLGQAYLSQVGLLQQAHPIIAELARDARETAFVGVMRNGGVVPIDVVEPEQPVRMTSRIGEAIPLHCTAAGKVHLAYLNDEASRLSLIDKPSRFTEKTIVERDALLAQLEQVLELGYAIEEGERVEDVNAFAVPVQDYTRSVVGSLSLTGPAYRMDARRIESEIKPLMLRCRNELSSRLGYPA